MARCPGDAGVRARWTPRALAGAFLDLAIVYAFLCVAAAASAASGLLALLGLPLPCTCSRPHLPCLLAFLSRYPSRVLESLLLSLRSRFPFVATDDDDHQQKDEEGRGGESVDGEEEEGDLRREVEGKGASAALQQELDKERSAAASAAEEAMAMILRLQKEKSALEIELRQQRRTSEERCAFYEDEVEELRDILLMRERESRSLQKEVESYRRLLGLAREEDEEEMMMTPHNIMLEGEEMMTPRNIMLEGEEMMTPRNIMLEGDPSSSNSVDKNGGSYGMIPLHSDSVFSFKTPFLREQLVSPIQADHVKGRNEESLSFQVPGEVSVVGSKLGVDNREDDGTETLVIPPLSTRSLDPLSARSLDFPLSARSFDQGGDVEDDAGMKSMEELTADEFQEVECGGIEKICHHLVASDNDANIYDVHVVDDICFSTEVKGLIGRSFSDATMQIEKLQNRAAADDVLGKSLNAIKGAQDKIRDAASESRRSLQLQLLEDIANQLQGIKDAADAGRHLHCTSPKSSKKS